MGKAAGRHVSAQVKRAGVSAGVLQPDPSAQLTTNLPAMLAFVIIIFCASATFSEGTSMARSPRATITPSVTLKTSS
jgi:hypothetical protein